MMHRQAVTDISVASGTLPTLISNDDQACFFPATTAIGLLTATPQWGALTCALCVVIRAFTGKRAKQPLLAVAAQFPGLALEPRPAVVACQADGRHIARVVLTQTLAPLERTSIWLTTRFQTMSDVVCFSFAYPRAIDRGFINLQPELHNLSALFARLLHALDNLTHWWISCTNVCSIIPHFAGIGSVPYVALKLGRRGVGIELKRSYYQLAREFLADLELQQAQPNFLHLAEEDA